MRWLIAGIIVLLDGARLPDARNPPEGRTEIQWSDSAILVSGRRNCKQSDRFPTACPDR